MPNCSKAGMTGALGHVIKGAKENIGKLPDLKQAICL